MIVGLKKQRLTSKVRRDIKRTILHKIQKNDVTAVKALRYQLGNMYSTIDNLLIKRIDDFIASIS